jgi:hypothetical protein
LSQTLYQKLRINKLKNPSSDQRESGHLATCTSSTRVADQVSKFTSVHTSVYAQVKIPWIEYYAVYYQTVATTPTSTYGTSEVYNLYTARARGGR